MTKQAIDVVTTNDTLPAAFGKVNSMMTELYGDIATVPHTAAFTLNTTTDLAPIVHTNVGATDHRVWTLPTGAGNYIYIAQRVAAYEIRLTPASGQAIGDGGTDKYLALQGRGRVVLQWIGSRWEVIGGDAPYNYEI